MSVRYTERAKHDLELAYAWYEKQRRGLGLEFLDCVEAALLLIIDKPDLYRIYYSNFRGCLIRRFPFTVFYTIEKHEIIVHAIFNNKQDPEKRPLLNLKYS